MNLVGKIFVVTVFVGSIALMAFAVCVYATHKNWKDEILRTEQKVPGQKLGYEIRLKDTIAEKKNLEAKLAAVEDALKAQQYAKINAVAALEAEIKTLGIENRTLHAANEQLVKLTADTSAALVATEDSIKRIVGEVGTLRTAIVTTQADRDAELQRVVLLTDAIHGRLSELHRLRERRDELTRQITSMTQAIKLAGVDVPGLLAGQQPPRLDGKVTAVGAKNLIEISLGRDDGLQEGHFVEISRANKYLGRARIVKTAPDKSVAFVLPDYKQGDILRGDRVDTNTKLASARR